MAIAASAWFEPGTERAIRVLWQELHDRRISFVFLLLNVFISWSVSAEPTDSYRVTGKDSAKLRHVLDAFDNLILKNQSSGTGPLLGPVDEDAGCSVRIFRDNGTYYSIFFEGKAEIDKKQLKFEEIEKLYPALTHIDGAKHEFFVAEPYLMDIERTSPPAQSEEETEQVILRISSPKGITVQRAVRYCGC